MIEEPQLVITGKTRDALNTICGWARNRGAGTTWTVKCGRQALEIRGMMKKEIEEIRLMAERAGLDIFNDMEVCGDANEKREVERRTNSAVIRAAA